MTDDDIEIVEMARELFATDSGLLSVKGAGRAIADIRAGAYDDFPMLRFGRAAILAERTRCDEIAKAHMFDEHELAQATEYGRAVHETAGLINHAILTP